MRCIIIFLVYVSYCTAAVDDDIYYVETPEDIRSGNVNYQEDIYANTARRIREQCSLVVANHLDFDALSKKALEFYRFIDLADHALTSDERIWYQSKAIWDLDFVSFDIKYWRTRKKHGETYLIVGLVGFAEFYAGHRVLRLGKHTITQVTLKKNNLSVSGMFSGFRNINESLQPINFDFHDDWVINPETGKATMRFSHLPPEGF